jgi:hypothetical protein
MTLRDAIAIMNQLGERAGEQPKLKIYDVAGDVVIENFEITGDEGSVYLEIH